MEEEVLDLKRRLDESLSPEERVQLLNRTLSELLHTAVLQSRGGLLARLKSHLYLSGVLNHCSALLDAGRLGVSWSAATTLAHLTSSCCVGVEPAGHSEAFTGLFLPSLMEGLLSFAHQLARRGEASSHTLFRKVMDSIGWLLAAHAHLTRQVLSSTHYEHIQMSDDVTLALLSIQMWSQTCSANRHFLAGLSSDSVLLLLNEAVGQLAVSSDSAVGRASIRLILLMASQLELRPLLLGFRGLDSLLSKDWMGRGFDQDTHQLMTLVQSVNSPTSQMCSKRVRAACVIQAAWRSYQTRRRLKSLRRGVCTLQRSFRVRARQRQWQHEAQQREEELKYQVCLRRQQARRWFYQRQKQLLQLLPHDQVQLYLLECERRAAVVIQSAWRGFQERRRYNNILRHKLRHTHIRRRAATTLQRAVRRFLQKRQAAKVPAGTQLWLSQSGLTDSQRVELRGQVEEYIAQHPSVGVSHRECKCLHGEVQQLLRSWLLSGAQQRRAGQKIEALLAHTHTKLEMLRDAPPLSAVTAKDVELLLSPSGSVAARARNSHNAQLRVSRHPWWRQLGEMDALEKSGPTHNKGLEVELEGCMWEGQHW
ncbi:IQ calmodulin-binding motif-containing protein 1 [Aulostomus maculatus]